MFFSKHPVQRSFLKTNQKFKIFFSSLPTVLLLAIIVASCSDSTDEPSKKPTNPTDLTEILCKNGWETEWSEEYGEWGNGNMSYSREKSILYFLGDGKGIARFLMIQDDTYFGHSRSDEPQSFNYTIDGNSVYVSYSEGGYNYFRYENGTLQNEYDSDHVLHKTDFDYEWIEKVKYVVMDDDERYNFPIGIIIDGDYKKSHQCFSHNKEEITLNVGLTIPASSKASARLIGYVRAVFDLDGSSWSHSRINGKEIDPELILTPSDYNDVTKVEPHEIPFDSKDAKLNVEIYYFDDKLHREVYVETMEFELKNYLKNSDYVSDDEPEPQNSFSTTVTPGVTVISNGDNPWTQNNNSFTSGNAGKKSTKSILYIQVNPSKSGYNELSFDWEVSSEQKYDKLIIKEADGLVSTGDYGDELMTESGDQSGHVDGWYVLGNDPRTFIVIYEKDGAIDRGDDRAIIKNIKLNGK